MKSVKAVALVFGLVSALSVSAFADPRAFGPEQRLVFKSHRISGLIRNQAASLDDRQVALLNQKLDEVLVLLGVAPDAPETPACQILTGGVLNATYYPYRLATASGTVLSGSHAVSDLILKLKQLDEGRACSFPKLPCTLETGGVMNHAFYSYRLFVNGTPFVGRNTLNEVFEMHRTLREGGICGDTQPGRCELLGGAVLNSTYYSQIIGIDGKAIVGSHDLNEALGWMNRIRTAGLCR